MNQIDKLRRSLGEDMKYRIMDLTAEVYMLREKERLGEGIKGDE